MSAGATIEALSFTGRLLSLEFILNSVFPASEGELDLDVVVEQTIPLQGIESLGGFFWAFEVDESVDVAARVEDADVPDLSVLFKQGAEVVFSSLKISPLEKVPLKRGSQHTTLLCFQSYGLASLVGPC